MEREEDCGMRVDGRLHRIVVQGGLGPRVRTTVWTLSAVRSGARIDNEKGLVGCKYGGKLSRILP